MAKVSPRKCTAAKKVKTAKRIAKIHRADLMLAILDPALDVDTVSFLSSLYEGVSIREKRTGKYIGNIDIDDSNSTAYNYFVEHSLSAV